MVEEVEQGHVGRMRRRSRRALEICLLLLSQIDRHVYSDLTDAVTITLTTRVSHVAGSTRLGECAGRGQWGERKQTGTGRQQADAGARGSLSA